MINKSQGGIAMIGTCILHEDYEDFATKFLGVDYEDFVNLQYGLGDDEEDDILIAEVEYQSA